MNKNVENYMRKQVSKLEVKLRDKKDFIKRVVGLDWENDKDKWEYVNPLHEEIEDLITIRKWYVNQLSEIKN
jgi:hypothetical protein